jgi:hypothetical protein
MPLTKEQFKRGVERCGGSVMPFSQDELVEGRAYMHKGACSELAAVWIRNRKLQASHLPLPDRDQCIEEISWLAEQRHKRKHGVAIDEFLQAYGLRANAGSSIFTRGLNLDKIIFFISAQSAYYLLGGVGESGHGVAFSTVNGHRFFDANFGIAGFPDSQNMALFFKAFWLEEYPDLMAQGFVQRFS